MKIDKIRCKSIFVSDIHLGTVESKAKLLLDSLKQYDFDELYLVGDIIDGWKIKRGWYWHDSHTKLIKKFLKYSKNKKVVYIAGNHDEFIRDFIAEHNINISGIEIADEVIYTANNGNKYLITHGDKYDIIIKYHKFVAVLGDIGYELLLRVNHYYNDFRRYYGFGYWSLSKFIKNKVKAAVSFITEFEEVIVDECIKQGVDGVICGHIHFPSNKIIKGIHYMNTGDFVETCSFVIETLGGDFEIKEFK
ncbi:MAG: UDP-2,3-diacylglucosamine diphosphatase [Flavobacterium sp.]|uniref:UDP-2,3-diacylglucosamine diphosphatase n=1 Tax=Flavobacterium sp. TaxID=239 RepID=UPI0026018CC7|nr:UDP-2,3-diacylglucosamine diphosphatase [Flavobacterium sp.]MDD5151126.1 UDP-2,3-diacylglucosamine diphosphatase [Flavobacterium sp.]